VSASPLFCVRGPRETQQNGFFVAINGFRYCRRSRESLYKSIHRHDGSGWLKIKNRNYSQAEGRHELLTKAKQA